VKIMTIFGSPIAEVSDHWLLYFVVHYCPWDHPQYCNADWVICWDACVSEAKYRGLLPLEGWAQWSEGMAA
jgi:hypothetical protein